MMVVRYRLLILNALLLLILLGSHAGRRLESASVAHTDFLSTLDMRFRNWKPVDALISASDMAVIEPDATLIRMYRGEDARWAELAVIAGHRKKTIHTPAFCMVGGGWTTETQQECTLDLPGARLSGMRMRMIKGPDRVLVTYFFTDGSYSTGNLVMFQGSQMLKRFGSTVPLGALVRITVPLGKDPADAEQLTSEFARATLPTVLATLRQTHLNLQ